MVTSIGLLWLRVSAGLMMAMSHGWPKLIKFSADADKFPDPLGVGSSVSMAMAIFGEFVCGITVALGLATRWTAVPVAITMAVAAGIVHAEDGWSRQEFPLLYFAVFITFIFTGGGKFSIDALLMRGK